MAKVIYVLIFSANEAGQRLTDKMTPVFPQEFGCPKIGFQYYSFFIEGDISDTATSTDSAVPPFGALSGDLIRSFFEATFLNPSLSP